MPSALQESRDFLARGVARVRSGLREYERRTKSPGPEIKVEPFDAQNVSTPAALIKLGTSIAAARRRKANLDVAQQDAELEREKNRAEIGRIRAQTAYYQGTGRQAAGPATALTPYQQASLDRRDRDFEDRKSARDALNKRIGRVTAAQAALRDIDASVERDATEHASRQMRQYDSLFQRAVSPDQAVRAQALTALGINVADYEDRNATLADRQTALGVAKKRLAARVLARSKLNVESYYRPDRERHRSVIEQGVQGFGEDAGDPLNIGDEDPLDLGG